MIERDLACDAFGLKAVLWLSASDVESCCGASGMPSNLTCGRRGAVRGGAEAAEPSGGVRTQWEGPSGRLSSVVAREDTRARVEE